MNAQDGEGRVFVCGLWKTYDLAFVDGARLLEELVHVVPTY